MDTKGIMTTLFLFVICGIMVAASVIDFPSKNNITDQEIAKMHEYMNSSINPCVNFYEYSCGNWLNSHSEVIKDPVNELDKIYNEKLENLLKENINSTEDSILRRLKIFYQSCKEQKKFQVANYLDIMKPIENISWPLKQATWQPKEKWNVWQTLGQLASIGFRDLFFSVAWKKDNNTVYQLVLNQGGNIELKLNNTNKNVTNFLQNLKALSDKYAATKKSTFMTISELQSKVPNIDFLAYFNNLFKDIALPLNSVTLEVSSIEYYKDLGDLIQKTSPDTLVHTMQILLEQYIEEILPQNCLNSLRSLLPLALNYVYDKFVYQQQKSVTDKVVQQIFSNLQMQFEDILKNDSQKFTLAEQTFLNNKIEKMQLNIGNLQLHKDSEFYFKYYQDWHAKPGNFYLNHLSALRHKKLEDLGVYSFLLKFSPTFENVLQVFYPFYLFPKNVLVVPFQYLTSPEFQPEFSKLLQYGDLGYSMSHAMMYGFSPFGLQYSAEGVRNITFAENLLNKPPLNDSIKCINATHPYEDDIKMTDFIGFRLAYDTYFDRIPDANKKLDDALSNKQLFYLRFAQSECIVRRLPTYTELPVAIQNIVNNGRDFEKLFGCTQGARDHNKCEIW